MTDAARDENGTWRAISVGRALDVLNAFMGEDATLSMSELARLNNLPTTTMHRLVLQLTDSGYLVRVGRRYQLSTHVLRLGNQHAVCRPGGLREVAAPYLAGLFQHTGFVVNLAVLEGSEVVYIDRIQGPKAPRSPSMVGGSLPALTTALGKAIVAFSSQDVVKRCFAESLVRSTPYSVVAPGMMRDQLLRARETGVAYDRQEAALGLTCVAAPILSATRAPLGAISVSGPVVRLNPESVASLVLRAASLIANDAKRAADFA